MHRPRLVNYDVPLGMRAVLVHGHQIGAPPPPDYDGLAVDPGAFYTIDVDSSFSGKAIVTQTIVGYWTNELHGFKTHGDSYLDNSNPYSAYFDVSAGDAQHSYVEFDDAPQEPCAGHTELSTDYSDYVQFKPDAGPGLNIYVPLGLITWHIRETTSLSLVPGANVQDYTPFPTANQWDGKYFVSPTVEAGFDGLFLDWDLFPYWTHTYTNGEYNQ